MVHGALSVHALRALQPEFLSFRIGLLATTPATWVASSYMSYFDFKWSEDKGFVIFRLGSLN